MSKSSSKSQFYNPIKKIVYKDFDISDQQASFYNPYSGKKPEKKIIKKPSPLIAMCLVKYYKKSLEEAFNKIRFSSKIKFNLQLINEKKIRNMRESFLKIYIYTLQKNQQKLKAFKQHNKNPSFMYKLLNKIVKKTNKQSFKNLKIYKRKKIFIQQFVSILQQKCLQYDKHVNMTHFFDKLKIQQSLRPKKISTLNHILIIRHNAQIRMKIHGFQSILNHISHILYEDVKKAKAHLAQKVRQQQCNRHRMMQTEKQMFKKAKFNLQHDSSVKNKSKVDMRMALSSVYKQSTQQTKKNQKIIKSLNAQIQKQKITLDHLINISKQRNLKLKVANNMKDIAYKTFQKLSNSIEKEQGKIQITKDLIKQSKKIQQMDIYAIVKNQNIRSEINFYEDKELPQRKIQGIIQQNKVLKQIIRAITQKQYQDYLYRQLLI